MGDKEETVQKLEDAIATFVASQGDGAISASRPVNSLLEIWAIAAEVHPSVAEPVELLLTALVSRELTTSAELEATMDAVHMAVSDLEMSAGV